MRLVLTNCSLIDCVSPTPVPESSIVVEDGRIAEILDGNRSPDTRDAAIIDLGGRYRLPGLWDDPGGTGRFVDPRVDKLVITDRVGIRNQHGRATGARQFRQRRRTGARDDDVGVRIPAGQVREKRRDRGRHLQFRISAAHLVGLPIAGLMDDPPTGPAVSATGDGLDDGIINGGGPLAAPQDQQSPPGWPSPLGSIRFVQAGNLTPYRIADDTCLRR